MIKRMTKISVDILMSTMNRVDLSFIDRTLLDLLNENSNLNLVIVNQCSNKVDENLIREFETSRIRIISYRGSGLSDSRNIAINAAKSEVSIIADDDVKYQKDYFKDLLKNFEDHPNLDIHIGKIETPQGSPDYKNYVNKEKKITWMNLGSISSIEISFRTKLIQSKQILFDNNFGLGSQVFSKGGEEVIFISDCIRTNMFVKYFPIYVVEHPYESSGKDIEFNIFYQKYLGALSFRLFGIKGLGLGFYYLIRHRKRMKNVKERFNFLKLFFSSFWRYSKTIV